MSVRAQKVFPMSMKFGM